jgi:NitT/TauT family transport system permease protein
VLDTPRRRARARVAGNALPALGVAVAVAAWWLAVELFDVQEVLVPAPPDVVAAFRRLQGYMIEQAGVTLAETLVGFGLAIVVSVLIAVGIASFGVLERMVYPLLVALNAVPKLALAPLFVMWMGFDQKPKIVMVLLLCFFPIVISTTYGLTSTPAELIEYARSLGTARWRIFLKVRLPHALPQVFVGLKVASTLAVIGAVIGEFVGGDEGLGFVIQSAGANADTPVAFAAIVLLGAMGVLLFYVVAGVERLMLPWARETTSAR